MEISIQQGLPQTSSDKAAELYELAFGIKIARAIPEQSDRVALLNTGFNSDFAITAFHRERLVGLAGFHTNAGSLTSGITAAAIIRRLGLMHGLRACFILALYERKPKSGELVMDGIAVLPEYRGHGIGTKLLTGIVSHASDHGYKTTRLDVIDSNPKARALYERFGFKVIREETYPFLKPVLGFGGSATMEYRIMARN